MLLPEVSVTFWCWLATILGVTWLASLPPVHGDVFILALLVSIDF